MVLLWTLRHAPTGARNLINIHRRQDRISYSQSATQRERRFISYAVQAYFNRISSQKHNLEVSCFSHVYYSIVLELHMSNIMFPDEVEYELPPKLAYILPFAHFDSYSMH